MKIISLRCPECNATLHIDEGVNECYCQYCGAKLFLDDENVSVIHTYRKVDEARLKEAEIRKELKMKRMELEKEEREKEREDEKRKTIINAIILIAAVVIMSLGQTWIIIWLLIFYAIFNQIRTKKK